MFLVVVNILIPLLSLIGILCLAHKYKTGFVIFLVVEFCMMYIGYTSMQYGIIAQAIVYFFSNIYAYWQWSREV